MNSDVEKLFLRALCEAQRLNLDIEEYTRSLSLVVDLLQFEVNAGRREIMLREQDAQIAAQP